MPTESRLRRDDYYVADVPLALAQAMVREYHYAAGGSNTRVYTHGLFRKSDDVLLGITWWIPPTKSCALATYPANWKGVLNLSRLVIHPDCPANACTFLLSRSRKLIDRAKWPVLITYADEWRGHTGAIYKADNWAYLGKTKPERTYTIDGRMVARKAGPKTRTHSEMLALGAILVGAFSKHKFARTEVM